MGNSVWAGVTWSRCGAVVAPSLTEYTIIHQSPLITDRFIPKHCIIDESVLCIQVYYALARPVVGNREVQSIITQLGELYLQLRRQNLLILEKFFNPNWRREKIPVILERNCWFCWNLWTFEIARDRIEEPESACVGIWDRITFPSTEEKTSMILRSSEGAKLQQYWYDYMSHVCLLCFQFLFSPAGEQLTLSGREGVWYSPNWPPASSALVINLLYEPLFTFILISRYVG